MNPTQLAKSNTEHAHQRAFFAYCKYAELNGFRKADLWANIDNVYNCTHCDNSGVFYGNVCECSCISNPLLKWIHAVPNGGSRGDTEKSRMIEGGKLKAEGVKPGVLDVFWPFPYRGKYGLYIEFKKPKLKNDKNKLAGLSADQIEFGAFVAEMGYYVQVAYSWQEAVKHLKNYLNM